jgi:hypothetical protein
VTSIINKSLHNSGLLLIKPIFIEVNYIF